MALDVERGFSCGIAPVDEWQNDNHEDGQILNPQLQRRIWQAVGDMGNPNKRNIWTEGVKKYLQYAPRELEYSVAPMDNPSMLRLVSILQARHTFIITEEILEEVSKDQNLPS